MADAWQRRCRRRSVLPAHARLVQNRSADRVWSRAPSGLAIGGAAAGLVVLGKQFSTRTVALTSGVVCAILPRATWAGIEARPYALSMMAAVWLTVLLVYAVRRDSAWVWLSYGIVLAVSILLDVYLVLMSPVHLVFVYLLRCSRHVVTRFAVTTAVGAGAVTPMVIAAVGQAHQISWVAPIGHRTIEDVAIQQYFERSPPFAIVSALLVAMAILLWLFTSARPTASDRQLLTLSIGWLVLPTAAIVAWSALVHPIYTPRYLSFTAPAIALILGLCIGALAVTRWEQRRLSSACSPSLQHRITLRCNVAHTPSMVWTTAKSPISSRRRQHQVSAYSSTTR